jgi:hypothetical protein
VSDAAISQKIYEMVANQADLADPTCASADMGMVHRYERWAVDWSKFIALFKDPVSGKIFGWEVCRSQAVGMYISSLEEQVNHVYVLKGYMAIQDADETDSKFNAKIELLRARFRTKMTMDGMNELPAGFQVATIDARMFGGVLCHYCEIRIPVQEVQV